MTLVSSPSFGGVAGVRKDPEVWKDREGSEGSREFGRIAKVRKDRRGPEGSPEFGEIAGVWKDCAVLADRAKTARPANACAATPTFLWTTPGANAPGMCRCDAAVQAAEFGLGIRRRSARRSASPTTAAIGLTRICSPKR